MGLYVVKNGDWYLSEGPAWAVSTWVTDERQATKYQSFASADEIAKDAIENGHRPMGERSETTKAVEAT